MKPQNVPKMYLIYIDKKGYKIHEMELNKNKRTGFARSIVRP
ncbi:Uncharacterised protein [Yersinia rohdei]|uniref:Uncharacterized protein n=1 Tax=Yersinia rohdei TaxID=29485 RepID=A0A0U1HV46_YERRO|nr:Uncharacterised protein [Yersinia rohdei]